LADRRKFRTRLERGEKNGSTEIYMTHRTVAGAPDDGKNIVHTNVGDIDTGYRLDSDKTDKNAKTDQLDSEIDAELLRRLMVKLGLAEKQAQQVVAGANVEKRAEVVKEPDSSVTLVLTDPYDRGWRRVGLALDRIGFVTEDKDRSNGLYYVRYTDVDIDSGPSKKKGFFDSLKFWGKSDEEEQPKSKDDKSVIDKLKFWKGDDGKTDPSKQYRIKLTEKGDDATQVNIVTEDGKNNRSTTANRIIQMLYEQLK
jgi:outer membrane protein assembly factor BamC